MCLKGSLGAGLGTDPTVAGEVFQLAASFSARILPVAQKAWPHVLTQLYEGISQTDKQASKRCPSPPTYE